MMPAIMLMPRRVFQPAGQGRFPVLGLEGGWKGLELWASPDVMPTWHEHFA
jgi:hypothetical protein